MRLFNFEGSRKRGAHRWEAVKREGRLFLQV